MAHTRTRLSLVEYGAPVDLSREIAAAVGVDRTKANRLLLEAGNRAASSLRLNYNPISVDAKGTRAIDFAGLIRLAPSLELEVAPKFLGSRVKSTLPLQIFRCYAHGGFKKLGTTYETWVKLKSPSKEAL